MASKQKKLSLTQLQKQLETWEKMQPDIYEDIISSAKVRGIVLKSGKISKSKKKQKQVASFTSEYQNKYGSYTSYSKKRKLAFQSYKEETGYKGSFKKYIAEQYQYSQLISELFENFSSDEAYEEYVYVESLQKEVAIERLKKEIAEHRIFYAEEYIKQYEDYEPPF